MRYFLFSLVVALFAAHQSIAQVTEEAILAYKNRDYETAFNEVLPLAEEANMQAMLMVGLLHIDEENPNADFIEGYKWLRSLATMSNLFGDKEFNEFVLEMVDLAKAKMTETQILEAEKLTIQFLKKKCVESNSEYC